MLERPPRYRQVAVFLVGGGLSAVIDVGLMQILIMAGGGYLLAASGGFLAGLLFNYFFHSKVTFQESPSAGSFVRYLTLVAINYAFTLACVALAVALGSAPVIGKLVSLPLIAVNGFVIGKYWIFK